MLPCRLVEIQDSPAKDTNHCGSDGSSAYVVKVSTEKMALDSAELLFEGLEGDAPLFRDGGVYFIQVACQDEACASTAGGFNTGVGDVLPNAPRAVQTLAGTGVACTSSGCGDGGSATAAQLDSPQGVAVDMEGNVFIADTGERRVRIVTPSGTVSAFAGTGAVPTTSRAWSSLPLPAETVPLEPVALAVDQSGRVFIAEARFTGAGAAITSVVWVVPTQNSTDVYPYSAAGTLSLVAGQDSVPGYAGDGGAASSALLNGPVALAVDSLGDLYIADMLNSRVRKVAMNSRVVVLSNTTPIVYTTTPQISTFAGNGVYGFGGDGGPAASAQFRHVVGLAFDPRTDDLYIVDQGNSRIRRVTNATGIIDTFAGLGLSGDTGDGGLATVARLNLDRAHVAVDTMGFVFVSDRGNNRIRRIDPSTGIIDGYVGNGVISPLRVGGYAALPTTTPFRDGVTLRSPGQMVFPPLPVAPIDVAETESKLQWRDLYMADEGSHQVRQLMSLRNLAGVCVYGAPCQLKNLTGLGASNYALSAGDRLAVMRMKGAPCGRGTSSGGWPMAARGMPQNGVSQPATDAADFSFGPEPVLALPGHYQLCWCPSSRGCSDEVNFAIPAGILIVKGPFLGNSRTCHVGQACGEAGEVASFRGVGLSNGDRLMAMVSCSELAGATGAVGFPEVPGRARGVSLEAEQHGSMFSWGTQGAFNGAILAGGEYRLCWCPKGYECNTPSAFGLDIGQLSVVGPYVSCDISTPGQCADQNRDVVGGTVYNITDLAGLGLQDGDALMILETCGVPGAMVDGFPNGGVSNPATEEGSAFIWGTGEEFVTAKGGEYRLCWCQAGRSCAVAENFNADIGSVVVRAPVGFQAFACATYERCSLSELQGVNLQDGDLVQIMSTCAQASGFTACIEPDYCVVPGSQRSSKATQSDYLGERLQYNNLTISFGPEEVRAPNGAYRLCWCGGGSGSDCSSPSGFAIDAGAITIAGPQSGQDRTCVSSQSCTIYNITGSFLEDGDRLMLLESCRTGTGITDTETPLMDFATRGILGFPDFGRSLPATDNGATFTWGSDPISTGGKYKMCWCSRQAHETLPCDRAERFKIEVGMLTVVGFAENKRSCFVGQPCEVEHLVGFPLHDGDQVLLQPATSTCGSSGEFPGASLSGFAFNTTEHVHDEGGGGIVQDLSWSPLQLLPGSYQLCWCSALASCANSLDFQERAGSLEVLVQTIGHLQLELTEFPDSEAVIAEVSFQDCAGDPLNVSVPGRWNGSTAGFEAAVDGSLSTAWVVSATGTQVLAYSVPDQWTEVNGVKYLRSDQYELCRYSIATWYTLSSANALAVGSSSRGRLGGWTLRVREAEASWENEIGASALTAIPWEIVDSQTGHTLGWEDLQVRSWVSKYVGPLRGHYAECRASLACDVPGILGVGLAVGDRLMALSEVRGSGLSLYERASSIWNLTASSCGSGTPPAGLGSGATLPTSETAAVNLTVPAGRIANFTWGDGAGQYITASGGLFRLCWCGAGAAGLGCQTSEQFGLEAGHLRIRGPGLVPHETYSWICVVEAAISAFHPGFGSSVEILPSGGADFGKYSEAGWLGFGYGRPPPTPNFTYECNISDVFGEDLTDGDRLLVLDRFSCTDGLPVPGWPGNSLSMPSTSNGSHFFFGADLPSTVDVFNLELQTWGDTWEVPRPYAVGGHVYGLCWCPQQNPNCVAATAASIAGTAQVTGQGSGTVLSTPAATLEGGELTCARNNPNCHQSRNDFNLPLGRLVVLNHTSEVRLCWQRCHDKYPEACRQKRSRLVIPGVVDFSSQYDNSTFAAANLGLRSGGQWRSSFNAIQDQWLVLDLGEASRPSRFMLPLWGTAENPREARLQSAHDALGPWEDLVEFGIPSWESTLVTVEIPDGPVARFLRLGLAGNFGAPWGLALRGPLRLAVDPDAESNSTGEDGELDELCARSYCYSGCGLLARRTIAENGMAVEELPPATGDAALLNFEWPLWVQQLVKVNASGCEAWAPSCSAHSDLQSACLDGCEFWRGPTARGELGFFCNMGVDLTGALVGVDGASRVTLQNSSNVSCVLNVSGQQMRSSDYVQVVPGRQPCRTAQASAGASFLQPRAAATTVAADGSWATFDLGYPTASGPFQVCYCLGADDCSQDWAFSKWAGTVAVIGKVRRMDPSGWDLGGQVSVLLEITDLGAPIINVTFISHGLERPCLSPSPVFGQETTAVQCLMPAAFSPGLETVTAFTANGLWATSVDIFNRFVRGGFINISDTFGPTVGGDIVTIYVSDLGAPIVRVTFGFIDSPSVADGRMPGIRATVEVPATAVSGLVTVTVTASNGNVATGSNVYSYYRAGDISNLNPPQGEMAGGTRVTIETTDLDATIVAVFFGGNEGLIVGGSATSNFVVALTPESEVRGAVDVVVLAENQNEAISIGGFTYLAVCPDPGIPLNGARSGEDLSEGAVLIFSCQFGYELVGSAQSVCQMDYDSFGNVISETSAFAPPVPTCQIVSCPDPGIPDFGFRAGGESGTFVFGDVVTFSCSPGYLRVGPTELLCRGDGQFSGSAPSCESNLGSLNLVRYRALFLASFGEEEGVSQLAYQEADANRDGLVSEEEFLVQAAAIGVTRSADAEVLYQQIQLRPGTTLTQQYITLEQYRVLEPEVSITELRTLMASVFLTPAQMLAGASLDGNPSVSKEEFVGQVVSVAELTTVNAEAIWDSVARLGQSQLDSNHYLLLMGQDDLQTLRALMQVRFILVDDAWNASNPNGDDRVTEEEFVGFLLQDYGLDAVMGELSWRHIDVFFQGYVLLERYVALGFGSVEGVSLVGFRGFLQSLFATKEAVVSNMDSDGSGIVTNEEFKRFVTRTLGLTAENADDVLASLCQAPSVLRLTERQLDAISYDLTLPSLRILLRADHPTVEDVLAFLDTSQDGQISQQEWAAGLLRKRVTSVNARDLFEALDPGQLGYLTVDTLRLIRGNLALCDYRELVKPELGDLNQTLWDADTDGNLRVTPEEFVRQAMPFCLTEAEALAVHAEMDFLSQGFVDLFPMSPARMPFVLQRGSLASYRSCLQSYFGDAAAAVQDLAVAAAGFPASARALAQQGAKTAWLLRATSEQLFDRADPLASGLMSRARYQGLFAGTMTLVGFRLLLAEVAPDGSAELISRADVDRGGGINLAEFIEMGLLLRIGTSNSEALFGLLNYSSGTELGPGQLRPVSQTAVTLVDLRLLALGEFPGADGQAEALAAADQDRSQNVELAEFLTFAGTVLAVNNATNAREIFDSLDVSTTMRLRPMQLWAVTAQVVDLPLLRHLVTVEFSGRTSIFGMVDTSADGGVDQAEMEQFAWRYLALGPASVPHVFSDLDMCQFGVVVSSQLAVLTQNASVVVLRALLASRFRQQEHAIFASADLNNNDFISAQEFATFLLDLFVGATEASTLFETLDTDSSGALSRAEMHVVSGNDLKLFDFRRLISWTFDNPENTFQVADFDGNGLVSELELQRLGCRSLALRGNVTAATVFRAVDEALVGEVSVEDFGLAVGSVEVMGLRTLVQSVFSAGVEAFLSFDANGDRLLQRSEFEVMATALAISGENVDGLFDSLASRNADVVHLDIFLLAANGLAEFRSLLRDSFRDVREALLDFDTSPPWNEVSYEEFYVWCEARLQLPTSLIPEIFTDLDTRKEGFLRPSHFEMLLAAEVGARSFGQLLGSALGDLAAAFDEADGEGDGNGLVTLEELTRLASPLGVRSANVAKLFTELDIDRVGSLTKAQFEVMSLPNRIFRLSNGESEPDRIHVYEMRLFRDDDCLSELPCDLPVASGHFLLLQEGAVVNPNETAMVYNDVSAGRAFDRNFSSRWISQCGPCRAEEAWIGCKFDLQIESGDVPMTDATPAPAPAAPATGPVLMSLGAQSRECVIFANIGAHASEINQRIRLLDNDIRVMKSEQQRLTHEIKTIEEKTKDNKDSRCLRHVSIQCCSCNLKEKIKLNRQLPHLVANVAEILELEKEEDDEDGAMQDIDTQRDGKSMVIKTTTRQTIFLPVIGLVEANDLVGVNKDSYLVLDKLPPEYDSRVKAMEVDERPTDQYSDIGGLEKQIQELQEAIVLPMTHKDPSYLERFENIGIQPPKGVLMHGPPGTGKTMMARACAAATNATFLKLAGPQLVQMFIGDGAKIVRDAFVLAKEMLELKAPAIIFIDELDAIGQKRSGGGELSGVREVQRTMLELLNQLDGFTNQTTVKIIAATNRPDTLDRACCSRTFLDPALLRSGRLDRKIELPHPNEDAAATMWRQVSLARYVVSFFIFFALTLTLPIVRWKDSRARIMQIHSRKMNYKKDDVNFVELARSTDDFNGAQLKAVCVEAGMEALRRGATELCHEERAAARGQVRCMQLYQTPPATVSRRLQAKEWESSSSSSEEDEESQKEPQEGDKVEAAAPCTTAKAKPPEPPAKQEKKKEKEKDRKRRKESRRRRSKDRKRSHRSRSRSRGRRRDRPRSRPAARLVSAARPKLRSPKRPRSPSTGPTTEQRALVSAARPKLRSPKRPRSPSTGPTTEQRAALLRLRLAGSKGGTPVRGKGQRSPARAASLLSQHTPTGRAACAVCGRMVSQTAQAAQQHSYSVFHLMAVERAARPGRPEEEYRAAAERHSAEAWEAYYEEGTAASTKAPSTRRATQHRGKKKAAKRSSPTPRPPAPRGGGAHAVVAVHV
eukprot:s1728_g7.t1